jgi:hypothetical protein
MPGARCTRSLACEIKQSTRASSPRGPPGSPGIPARNGFNGFLRALPGDRACLPPSSAKVTFRELDTSVGAPGPHAFSVHLKRRSSCSAIRVHRVPPRVRDDRASAPLVGRDGEYIGLIWVFGKSEYFCKRGWTRGAINCPGDLPVGQISRPVRWSFESRSFASLMASTAECPVALDTHGPAWPF